MPRISATRDGRIRPEVVQTGVLDLRSLPDPEFDAYWNAVVLDQTVKDRLLGQAVLSFTLRERLDRARLPLHGVILLQGPPGTGKTSLARGLASRTADAVDGLTEFRFLEVEPHELTSSALGRSQRAVRHLLGTVIAEYAETSPLIVLLDEVETLAASRAKISLETNPIDVHRATDAVLAQVDHLAASYPHLLFVATSNFPQAVDEAFLSRADLLETIGLPGELAVRQMIKDSVQHLAEQYPEVSRIVDDPEFELAVRSCVGLDGREIRKVVLAACAQDKSIALDPARLTAADLHSAIQRLRSGATYASRGTE